VQLLGRVPREEGGIHVLTGKAAAIQTVGSLLRTPWPSKLGRIIWQNVSLANSLQCKNTLNNFQSNALSKVKKDSESLNL
jgi:hypothetical protein